MRWIEFKIYAHQQKDGLIVKSGECMMLVAEDSISQLIDGAPINDPIFLKLKNGDQFRLQESYDEARKKIKSTGSIAGIVSKPGFE